MKTYGLVQVPAVLSMKCDSCGYVTENKDEMEEWLSYDDTAGYSAKYFSDMTKLKLDLCEKCKFDLLGKYIQKTEY